MRTGRPVKSDTIYKMQIHVNGSHRYASTQPFTIGEDGKKRYTHKHWGTLDENLRFHPNATYLYASIEERSKCEILSKLTPCNYHPDPLFLRY